jgi:hypothetical protein
MAMIDEDKNKEQSCMAFTDVAGKQFDGDTLPS